MANGHGGKRVGAGRPRKSLAEKQLEGTYGQRRPKVLNFPAQEDFKREYPERLEKYTSRSHSEIDVHVVWTETVAWLEKTGCLHLINPAFIDEYAILKSRFYECERIISMTHPIYDAKDKNGQNKGIEANPAIDASIKYMKMADAVWDKIWSVVAQNCEVYFGDDPNQDIMARLLNSKPG